MMREIGKALRTFGRMQVRMMTFAVMSALLPAARAQISLPSAVDLALRSNPRVKMAQDEVAKARAQLSEAQDVYIPSINAGAGLGQAYGYSEYPPTLFTISGGSLIYNAAQGFYIRSARAGVNAAQLSLQDARDAVAEDTALAFAALDRDQQREQAIQQQREYATRLVKIVEERVDAGQDKQIDLTDARLTAAQFHLALLRAQDDTAVDREHLARLIDLPPIALTVTTNFPEVPVPTEITVEKAGNAYATPAVAAAFASADARRQQAEGDSRFRYRPQIDMVAQYNNYATFTNSFKSLDSLYGYHLTANEAAFGVRITVPVLDRNRLAKARESAADAAHAFHEAQNAQIQALDGQSRMRRTIEELKAQEDVATLQQQKAQQQLDILRLQLQASNPNGPQMTPKDEQNALIAERDKYLGIIDADFQLHQAEIQLLRATGQLETWLKSAASQKP